MPQFGTPLDTASVDGSSVLGTLPEPLNVTIPALGTSPGSTPSLAGRLGNLFRFLAWYCDINLRARKDGTLTIAVAQGHYRYGGTDKNYAGSTANALTNNATNYVYLDGASNTLVINTTGFPGTPATFMPIAVFVTAAGAISTADYLADRRDLVRCSIESSSASPAGTDGTSFTLDQDNAGAGANGQLRQNRGSTDAEDAAVEWDETNDRWRSLSQHTTRTLCPHEASSFIVAGTAIIDTGGTIVAAGISATRLYTFGANGGTAYGVKLVLGGAASAPTSGAHTAGELALGSDGSFHVCTADGSPGTWQQVGKQDNTRVISIANASGASATNPLDCTIQVKDQFGNNVAVETLLEVHLMDDAGDVAYAANVTAVSVPTGTIGLAVTANKVYFLKTNASGTAVLRVTNSIADDVFVKVRQAPGSPALSATDEGKMTWS